MKPAHPVLVLLVLPAVGLAFLPLRCGQLASPAGSLADLGADVRPILEQLPGPPTARGTGPTGTPAARV